MLVVANQIYTERVDIQTPGAPFFLEKTGIGKWDAGAHKKSSLCRKLQ
jgi:hypothetical protein